MAERIIQFLKQTSIKGVHRIFLTKSYFLRTLWGISVICFLSMAAYQAFLLTKGYLEYNSIISMKETFSDFTGQTGRFPDVTFCNLNPFSVSTHNLSNIPSLGTYHDTILNKTSCSSCSTQEEDDLEELRKELLTTGGYYTTIGASKAELISHTQEAFVVSCKVGLLSGMHPRKIPCQGIATIVPFHDCVYFNCYTIKLPPATPEDLYGAIIVVLHLNNHLEIIEQQKFLTPHFLPSQMSGALMTLHEPDNIPVIIRDAINLPSGYFTSAKLSLVQRNSLPSPYGECKHKHDLGEKGVHYQQIICYSSCVRKLVLRSCGCVDLGLYRDVGDPDEYNSTIETNACLSSKLTSQKLRQNWACMKQIGLNATIPCLSSCPTPCEEVSYIKDMTYAPWPSSPYHDNFYERYISGRSYEPHYTSLLNKTFENTPEEDILLDKETVSQNFLGVQLVIGKQLVMNYEARPQLSLTAFLSQIGGALNLWAGITVVVLVEMLELGYRSLADLLKSKSVDSSSTEMKNHVKASATTQDEDEGYEL